MADYPNARDCEHGRLRRSCEQCSDAFLIAALEARLAEVEQALRFYADPANHAWPSPDQAWSNVDADNGDIARAVLDKGEPR